MVKKLVLIAAAAVAVIGAAGLSVQHYHQYQNKKKADQISQLQAVKQAQYNADQSVIKLLQAEDTRLQAECQKGAQAYAQLPAIAKAKVSTPLCTAAPAAR
jgi:hypothetical protein